MLPRPGRADGPGQEPSVPWKCVLAHGAVGGTTGERERQKEREIRREDEVEEEILRADVAAMVTSITHGGTNSTITNSFMFNGGVWVSRESVSVSRGSGPPTTPTTTVQAHPEVTVSVC